jgi:hypothetical protein
VEAIKKQLPFQNKVCLTWDGCTSPNKLAIISVIAYHMDPNWAFHEIQTAFDEIDRPFCSRFSS